MRGEGKTSAGVEGVSESAPGVFGASESGMGTGGRSNLGPGVSGVSFSGSGVLGFSSESVGVQGSSERDTGVSGVGPRMGVHGTSARGHGVVGHSTTGAGVLAESNSIGVRATGRRAAGDFRGDVFVRGDFMVTGAKSAVVPATDGSLQQLYCVEAPEPWFEDMGEAALVDGVAEIPLDPAFAAAITGKYQVHITPYAAAVLFVAERGSDGFVVKMVPNDDIKVPKRVGFSWRVMAKRGDIKAKRFAKVIWPDDEAEPPAPSKAAPAPDFELSKPVAIATRTADPMGNVLATPKTLLKATSKKRRK